MVSVAATILRVKKPLGLTLLLVSFADPVNVIQAELLKRLRSFDQRKNLSEKELEEQEVVKDALVVSINGVAQGMQNSG